MTPERLSELRELCDGATPEPWVRSQSESHQTYSIYTGTGISWKASWPDGDEECRWQLQDDRDFIAASRSALPELLDEIERLQRELGEARKIQDAICSECRGEFLTGQCAT